MGYLNSLPTITLESSNSPNFSAATTHVFNVYAIHRVPSIEGDVRTYASGTRRKISSQEDALEVEFVPFANNGTDVGHNADDYHNLLLMSQKRFIRFKASTLPRWDAGSPDKSMPLVNWVANRELYIDAINASLDKSIGATSVTITFGCV